MKIIFIDDDLGGIHPWVATAIDSGHECVVHTNPDDALEEIQRDLSIDVAVVDLMLPRGRFSVEETDSGLKTGIALLDAIRTIRGKCFPLVTLSILPDQMAALRQREVRFFRKPETDPTKLVAILEEAVRAKK